MNFLPLVGFYWRQHDKLSRIFDRTNIKEGGGARLLVDLAEANAPLLKARFPDINENKFLDDAIATLKEVTSGTSMPERKSTVLHGEAIKAHMSVTELEAGADAVHKVAESYGMASFITRDQERELAANVIRAFVIAHHGK